MKIISETAKSSTLFVIPKYKIPHSLVPKTFVSDMSAETNTCFPLHIPLNYDIHIAKIKNIEFIIEGAAIDHGVNKLCHLGVLFYI